MKPLDLFSAIPKSTICRRVLIVEEKSLDWQVPSYAFTVSGRVNIKFLLGLYKQAVKIICNLSLEDFSLCWQPQA